MASNAWSEEDSTLNALAALILAGAIVYLVNDHAGALLIAAGCAVAPADFEASGRFAHTQ